MIGVIGCLLTECGIAIKQEMLSALNMHTLFPVDQEPPGIYAEYPALFYAIKLAIDTKLPVLYVHTKGAYNQIPKVPTVPGRKSIFDFMPPGAQPIDWQATVRKMWYHEFTTNISSYLRLVDTDNPTVACPYAGPGKATWQNGFIMNSAAANELYKIFHYTNNRWWYEVMFNDTPHVQVIGVLMNHIANPLDDTRFDMYKSIWSFYKPNRQ